MKKSKLAQYLEVLEREEYPLFRQYLEEKFHRRRNNKKDMLLALFESLVGKMDSGAFAKSDAHEISKELWPDKVSSSQKLSKLRAELLFYISEFFIQKEFETQYIRKKLFLANYLRKKGAYHAAFNVLDTEKESLEKSEVIVEAHQRLLFELKREIICLYPHTSRLSETQTHQMLKESYRHLTEDFHLQKMKTTFLLPRKMVEKVTNPSLEIPTAYNSSELRLYTLANHLLSNQNEEEFREMVALSLEIFPKMKEKEQKRLYDRIRQIYYRFPAEKRAHLAGNMFSFLQLCVSLAFFSTSEPDFPEQFLKIVKIGVEAGKKEWVAGYISEVTAILLTQHKGRNLHFAKGFYYYKTGQYRAASSQFLRSISQKNSPKTMLESKRMLIQSYFEKGDIQMSTYALRAFQQFLMETREPLGKSKIEYFRFIRNFQKLNQKEKSVAIAELSEELKKGKKFPGDKWILGKLQLTKSVSRQ